MLARTLAGLAALVPLAAGARCNGDAKPGPRNLLPIDDAPPKFVKQVKNGKLYTVGQGDDTRSLIHLWGTPYDNGMAMGQLLGPALHDFINGVYD